MLNTVKKIPKKIKIIGTVFITVAFLCFILILNLEKALTFIVYKTLGVELTVKNIDLAFGMIKGEEIRLYDKKYRLMIDIPELELNYSILKLGLEKLDIIRPSVFIIKDEDGINIQEVFKKPKKEKDEDNSLIDSKEEDTKYEPKSIPIENINLNDLSLSYQIEKNNKVLEKAIKNININVKSGKNKGIEAQISSKNNPENFRVLYSNKEEPLYLEIKIDEIDLANYQELIEAELPKMKKLSGSLKADAVLSSKNRDGFVKLSNLDIYYSDIESDIKADFDIKLNKEDVDAIVDYEIFGEKNQMELTYRDGKLYSLIELKNIDEKKLSRIVPLRESKLNLSKIDIEDIIFLTQYDKDEGLRINFDLKPKKFEYGAVTLDKMRANLIIKDGVKTIENSHIFLKVADMPTKLNLEATILKNTADVLFQIHNLDKTSNLIPDFNGFIKLSTDDKNINAKLKSNIISFETDYNKEKKDISLQNEKFKLNYSKQEDKLSGSGELEFLIYGLKNYVKYKIEEDKVNFDEIRIENENNKTENLVAQGYYDLNTKNFKFNYDATNLTISRLYKDQKINFAFQGKGEFERYHSVLSGIGNIKGLNLSYLGDMKSLTGHYSLNLNENNEFELEFNGKAEELAYGNYKLKDVLVKLGFEKDILKIKKIGNDNISISGKIDKINQGTDLKLKINNLTNKSINFDKLDFNIKDIEGKITGNLENPNVDLDIKDIELFIQNKISKITGKIKVKDKKASIESLNLNKNKLNGYYNIENKKYKLNLSINDNLKNYIEDENMDYNLSGRIKVDGISGQMKSDLEIKGFGKLKDNILPNINVKANYSAKNYSDGIVKIQAIEAKNSKGKNLLNFKGDINLKNKKLNLVSDEILDFDDLREYIKNNDIQGKFKLYSEIKGEVDKPIYTLSLNSDQISIKNNKITEINSKLNGDKHSLNIETLSFKYLENQILAKGKYNLKSKKYNFNLKTPDIVNLNFLNRVLKDKGIKDIEGSAQLNLDLNNEGLNGNFKLSNFKLNDQKNYIKLSNFNSDIKIKDNKLVISETYAKINEGDLRIEGHVKIPKDLKNISNTLDYSINLVARALRYSKPDVADITFNSTILLSNKNIDGELVIDKGIIYDIPNDYKSLWSIISKKVLKKKDEKKKDKLEEKISKEKNKKKIKELSKKWDSINFRLKTREEIILDIEDFNIAVGEVKGKLDIDLNLEGGKGKYILSGNTEILNGYLYVSTNKFILDRALISFNDTKTYLPEINPDVFIDSRVTMEEENINFGIHGRLKKLMYTLSSESGNSSGSFNSLLVNSDRQPSFEGNVNEVYLKFMKNIIAGQIAEAIFGPVTKNMKKVLGLSKLIIKPEVSLYDVDSKNSAANKQARNSEVYDVGAVIEAEKKIYKDSVYLYGTAKLFGSNKNSVIQKSIEKNGIKEYDIGIEYRTKDDKVFGVGVGTVSDRYINEDRNKKKRNYHIDFKIRKKYNSFSEIFSF
ncbi:hypothetical protein [Fusobacterium russii]|uniref:hypothetical protein n=1 Tax=Fusobacterium russii TaxID=854 RepID=UPI0003A142A6|nr:hypothetical protein [Fusobacterium russii]